MDRTIRKYLQRQTARDYDNIRVTIAVEDTTKGEHKAAKPHYRRVPKQRSKDHDAELIREIVREVVAEMNRGRSSCDGCPNNRNNTTKKPKSIDDRINAVCKSKNGIEYRA